MLMGWYSYSVTITQELNEYIKKNPKQLNYDRDQWLLQIKKKIYKYHLIPQLNDN
jgi:hypothetical protein